MPENQYKVVQLDEERKLLVNIADNVPDQQDGDIEPPIQVHKPDPQEEKLKKQKFPIWDRNLYMDDEKYKDLCQILDKSKEQLMKKHVDYNQTPYLPTEHNPAK